MSNPFMEPRITSLEISMADLKEIVAETSRLVAENSRENRESRERSDREFARFQKEMKEGQNKLALEMTEKQDRTDRILRELSLEMREKQDRTDRNLELLSMEMRQSRDRTDRILDELSQDMKKFENEMQEERRKHNLEMGRIANKQGRMAEDFVAPSICRIMKDALGIDQKTVCIDYARVKRTFRGDRSKVREFDVIAECLDYALVNETKSSPTSADVNRLIKTMGVIRDYFPEFRDRKLIGAIASLFLNTSLINYASAKGILALAVGDDLMDIKNPAGFKPSFW